MATVPKIFASNTRAKSAEVNANFAALPDIGTYTAPTTGILTWTSGGVAPSIGNGTSAMRYMQIGKLVLVNYYLTFGTTTSGGSGTWYFAFPVSADTSGSFRVLAGNAAAVDSGVQDYDVNAPLLIDATKFAVTNSAGQVWTASTPFAFGSGDYFHINFSYIAA